MTGRPDLSVLVVSWNCAGDLPAALDSLPAACGALSYEVIAVDNASSDASGDLLERRPEVRLIRLDSNTGFTHAANLAARASTAPLLLFLNPDVVCPPDSLARLAAALTAHQDAWAATPWFRFPDGSPQYFWRRLVGGVANVLCFTRWGKRVDRLLGRPAWRRRCYRELPDPPPSQAIDGVGAACLLVRRDDFSSAGGLDERYLNFFSDGELERALYRKGRLLLGIGEVEVEHQAGATLSLLPAWELDAQYLQGLRQFAAGEPWWRRWVVEAGIRLDLRLPHPQRALRRDRALERLGQPQG